MVRKTQTSKEFRRHDDSIPYLDNAKIIFFLALQTEIRLSIVMQSLENLNIKKMYECILTAHWKPITWLLA